MKRGDVVLVVSSGDYGKPRPAVVVQSDWLRHADSVLVALMTSSSTDAPFYRLSIEPTEANGVQRPSQIMVDKIIATPRVKCRAVIGRLDRETMAELSRMIALALGLAD